ncbi:hypothetical protein [Peribacillus sp. SCS-155]|uniref:hypothetical protein n=1 Tax=Peribacillus sedimenti TaxID=3115297 RepID=UPI0039068724
MSDEIASMYDAVKFNKETGFYMVLLKVCWVSGRFDIPPSMPESSQQVMHVKIPIASVFHLLLELAWGRK